MSVEQPSITLGVDVASSPATPSKTAGFDKRTTKSGIGRLIGATRKAPVGAVAMLLLLAIVGTILLGPILPLADPQAPSLIDRLQPPMSVSDDGTRHYFGTDQLGRDVLSRTIYGGRISLGVALAAVVVSGIIGTLLGLLAGYRKGPFDYAIMRLVDFQMAMPSLLLAIFLIYLIGSSILNLVVLLSIMSWYSYTRIARSEALRLGRAAFVDAAIVCGADDRRILFRHMLPQMVPILTVIAVFDFSAVILAEAGISFLGFGVQPPQTSWGRMISEGQQFITTGNWWLFLAPGMAIFTTVLCVRLGSGWIAQILGTRDSTLH